MCTTVDRNPQHRQPFPSFQSRSPENVDTITARSRSLQKAKGKRKRKMEKGKEKASQRHRLLSLPFMKPLLTHLLQSRRKAICRDLMLCFLSLPSNIEAVWSVSLLHVLMNRTKHKDVSLSSSVYPVYHARHIQHMACIS